MHVRLWSAPYNGGWIWFDRAALKRFAFGRVSQTDSRSTAGTIWWAVLGFCGSFNIQTWPWDKYPKWSSLR